MGAQRATYAVIHYGPEHFWSFCLTLAHAFRKSLRFSTSAIGGRGSWSAVSGCVRTRVCLHGELARGLGGAVEFRLLASPAARPPPCTDGAGWTATSGSSRSVSSPSDIYRAPCRLYLPQKTRGDGGARTQK